MQSKKLSSTQFLNAQKNRGVFILSLDVLERHGEHLPLGTDTMLAHALTCEATRN
jgi:creatinine amidohydrolase